EVEQRVRPGVGDEVRERVAGVPVAPAAVAHAGDGDLVRLREGGRGEAREEEGEEEVTESHGVRYLRRPHSFIKPLRNTVVPTPRLRLLVPAAVIAFGAAATLLRRPTPLPAGPDGEPLVATFSIVGYDPETGDLGVAVQSKFPNVRAVVPWVEAGVGAVATQSYARLDYGIKGLALMRNGATAEEALRILVREDPHAETRQVGVVDARGNAATWTGAEAFDWAGGFVGQRDGGPRAAGAGVVVSGEGYTA